MSVVTARLEGHVARRLVQALPRGRVSRTSATRYPRFPPAVAWKRCRPAKTPIVQPEGSARGAMQALDIGSQAVDCGYRERLRQMLALLSDKTSSFLQFI